MSTPNSNHDAQWHHSCSLSVRGYELDSYRHVNHAVYLSYLEHARWEYLASRGLSLARLDELKRWPVVRRLQIDYRRPAFIDDRLLILSRTDSLGRASMEIEQEIRRGSEVLTHARIQAAIIDSQGRAVALPPDFQKLTEGSA